MSFFNLTEDMNKILVLGYTEKLAHFSNFFSHWLNSFIISLRNFHPKLTVKSWPRSSSCWMPYDFITTWKSHSWSYLEIVQNTLYWLLNCKDQKDLHKSKMFQYLRSSIKSKYKYQVLIIYRKFLAFASMGLPYDQYFTCTYSFCDTIDSIAIE